MGTGSSAPIIGVFTCSPVGKTHKDTVPFDLSPPNLTDFDLRNVRVSSVSCWESEFVHGLQFHYSMDGKRIDGPEARGEHGRPTLNTFDLEPDEYITRVSGRCGDIMDSIGLQTNKGRSKIWGGRGGDLFAFELPPGFAVISLRGGLGGHIHSVAPVFSQHVRLDATDNKELLELLITFTNQPTPVCHIVTDYVAKDFLPRQFKLLEPKVNFIFGSSAKQHSAKAYRPKKPK